MSRNRSIFDRRAEFAAEGVPRQARPAHGVATARGFREQPHVQTVNRQVEAKGAADVWMMASSKIIRSLRSGPQTARKRALTWAAAAGLPLFGTHSAQH